MFPLLLSLLLFIHLSPCRLTSGGDGGIMWQVGSSFPPSNYSVIQWDVLVRGIFSKGVWISRRQAVLNVHAQFCIVVCVSTSSLSIHSSIDALRTHRSRWSSWGGLCRSWLGSLVCRSQSPKLPNTPESPLHRPAAAQLIVDGQGEKTWDVWLKHCSKCFVQDFTCYFTG